MNTTYCIGIVSFVLLTIASASANAWELYRYRMPDGTVLYTDEVLSRGNVEEVLQEPPPDSARIEAERMAKLKREAAQADRIALLREQKLDEIDAQIRAGIEKLIAAKAALKSGLEPLPGERRGKVGGHSRLTDAYWSRIRELRRAVEDAREGLDDAYTARNALR